MKIEFYLNKKNTEVSFGQFDYDHKSINITVVDSNDSNQIDYSINMLMNLETAEYLVQKLQQDIEKMKNK